MVEKHNVSVEVTVEEGSHRHSLNLTAFYHKWTLSPNDEEDFLLKPIDGRNGGKGTGFYVTAQVLWRYGGAVEYYRIGGDACEVDCQALIHLKIPLRRT